MVEIPAATFMMGSTDNASEMPVHAVTLTRFWMDRTEVTVEAYGQCVATSKCTIPLTPNGVEKSLCNGAELPQHPVNCVDWYQATAYCAWKAKRLPTEEEWEYAARGTDGRLYPWGNDPPGPARLNACEEACIAEFFPKDFAPIFLGNDGWATTAPVGSYPAGRSPFGLDDMAGNVWEWTASDSSKGYAQPRNDYERVIRGGCSESRGAWWVRASFRDARIPIFRSSDGGFRCVRDG